MNFDQYFKILIAMSEEEFKGKKAINLDVGCSIDQIEHNRFDKFFKIALLFQLKELNRQLSVLRRKLGAAI